jgi:hypothetical protein
MILEVPATGERIAATLLEHSGVLCLKVAPSELIAYVLKGVLDAGWRIVDTRADERVLLRAHGVQPVSLDPPA